MKILFDHQAFSLNNHGGVSRYFSELINGINEIPGHEAYLPLLFSNNIHLEEKGFPTKNFLSNYEFSRKNRLVYELNKIYTLPLLKSKDYDILHPTYFDSYFIPHQRKKPLVVTFHDMIHEKFAHQFGELILDRGIVDRKRQLAQRADHIIAVSESTKRDIVEILNIHPEKIKVIYHGSSFSESDYPPGNTVPRVAKPYLLYVGSRKVYKNFGRLLTAVQPVLQKHDIMLVCAGGGSFETDEKKQMNTLGISDRVEQWSINDPILRSLYRQAIAFVYPSLYEGFGIPILEAFDCDCPCIINNCSSLPEVAGEAALYVDFDESASLANAVDKVLFDSLTRSALIAKGRRQLAKFSWQRTIATTLEVYESLL